MDNKQTWEQLGFKRIAAGQWMSTSHDVGECVTTSYAECYVKLERGKPHAFGRELKEDEEFDAFILLGRGRWLAGTIQKIKGEGWRFRPTDNQQWPNFKLEGLLLREPEKR